MTDAAARSGFNFRFGPALAATVFTGLLIWLTGRVAEVFLLLFLGILISLYLGALAGVLHRRARVPERIAFLLALVISGGVLVVLFYSLVPPLIAQTQSLVKVLPAYIGGWEAAIDRMAAKVPALRSVYTPGEHRILSAVYTQVSGQFGNVVPRVLGCKVRVWNLMNGNKVEALVADVGPQLKLGEVSVECARRLGIPESPINGGVEDHVIFTRFWPGVAATVDNVSYSLQAYG